MSTEPALLTEHRRDGLVVALDAGGTVCKGAVVDRRGGVLGRRRADTAAGEGAAGVLGRIEALLGELAADAAALGAPARAAGVALPGILDEEGGTVVFSANLPFRDERLATRLERAIRLPVVISHDVRAAARAELAFGAGRGARSLLFVAIGTGIAAATVLDGCTLDGEHGLAGEIGHVQVEPDGELCGCGRRGCLETVASASAIARRDAERSGRPGTRDAAAVLAAAACGDAVAAGVLADAVTALAGVLVTCQSLIDVGLIVLGGGLSKAGTGLTAPLAEAIADRCGILESPRLAVGELGDDAGCVGAALAAWAATDASRLATLPR